MEPLFINTYQMTPELLREYTNCMTAPRRKVLLVFGILCFIWGILFTSHAALRVLLPVLGVTAILCSVFYSAWLAKKNYRRYEMSHAGLDKAISFYPDRMECVNDGGESKTFYYRHITREKESGSLYSIVVKNETGIIVKKDSFQKGTFEEFREFMKQGRHSFPERYEASGRNDAPSFENSYQVTPELLQEYTKCMTASRRTVHIVLGVVYLAWGLLFPVHIVLKLLLIVLGVLFLFLSVFYSSRLAKRNYRVYELSHTGMGKTILFYPDRIECANDGEAAKTYYYSQISRVKESSGLYVIVIEKTIGIMVKKDAFQKGDFEEFQNFMKQGRQP
ncbi:hypothetical protein HMPREF1093_03793 [Hungatella hathewayi 12489931]|uniref:YcxB family protein n=1 Tax=Hungatella hathewayi TaxID=154046 RepID=UPI0002D204AC|nr:YcxB family protein [Hungatella hathewayi]ENY93716.1 hypothetical protein HMPREF1093_03793 [Hungatella hathewayi 12489931]